MTIQWIIPVCQLDDNNLFVGIAEAELDVYARDGRYLIPAGCIETAKPEQRDGFAAKWNGHDWDYVQDLRGKTAYRTDSGDAVTIDTVGELSDGLTLEPRPSEAHEWQDGAWVENTERAAEIKQQALDAVKAAKLTEINNRAQAVVEKAAQLDKVPQFEVETWPLQAAEAQAWAADKNAKTPVLAGIAAARGLDLDTLRAAALQKANAYTALSAYIAGQRQGFADKLDKAVTAEEVDELAVVYKLPSAS